MSVSKEREARRAQLASRQQQLEDAREAGHEHFKACPDQMLVAVWQYAASCYEDIPLEAAFLQGYIEARQRRDEYQSARERRDG